MITLDASITRIHVDVNVRIRRSHRRLVSGVLAALAAVALSSVGAAPMLAAGAPHTPAPVHTFECTGGSGAGPCPQGGRPNLLLPSADGTIYGAAQVSMEGSSNPQGGTLFALRRGGQFTLLHTFTPGPSKTYPGGDGPNSLIEAPDGNLYGTAGAGGAHRAGLLFRLSKTGAHFQILHQFCSSAQCADGGPGGLSVVGSDGNLYGITAFGGNSAVKCTPRFPGCGTIFRFTPSTGAYQVLFRFSGAGDDFPSGLVQAADGTLYGLATTHLFSVVPATGAVHDVSLPFIFPNLPFGGSGLVLGPNGRLYGLYTSAINGGAGLFSVAPDGSHFQAFPEYNTQPNGGTPRGLVPASDGSFWIADYNGANSYGDIVRVSPADGALLQTVTTFHASDAVGAYPVTLLQASDGTFWGTTDQFGRASSGHFADGVVFSLRAG